MYIWLFSRSDGAGSAMTRKTRGLTRSVRALIVPPLPAPSRPSNTMQTLRPLYLTHSWSFTSSTWSFFRAFSDFFLLSLSPSSLPAAFAMGASCRSRALTHDRLHEQLALFPVHAVQPHGDRLDRSGLGLGKIQHRGGAGAVALHPLDAGTLEIRRVFPDEGADI